MMKFGVTGTVFAWWRQYAGPASGHYPGVARRLRRRAEIVARREGWAAPARLIEHTADGRRGPMVTGAPGLLGGAPSAAEYAERRAAAYGPGRLP
jgi:hypothetical protein